MSNGEIKWKVASGRSDAGGIQISESKFSWPPKPSKMGQSRPPKAGTGGLGTTTVKVTAGDENLQGCTLAAAETRASSVASLDRVHRYRSSLGCTLRSASVSQRGKMPETPFSSSQHPALTSKWVPGLSISNSISTRHDCRMPRRRRHQPMPSTASATATGGEYAATAVDSVVTDLG